VIPSTRDRARRVRGGPTSWVHKHPRWRFAKLCVSCLPRIGGPPSSKPGCTSRGQSWSESHAVELQLPTVRRRIRQLPRKRPAISRPPIASRRAVGSGRHRACRSVTNPCRVGATSFMTAPARRWHLRPGKSAVGVDDR